MIKFDFPILLSVVLGEADSISRITGLCQTDVNTEELTEEILDSAGSRNSRYWLG